MYVCMLTCVVWWMSYRHKLNILIESFYKEVEKLRDAVIQVSDLLLIFFLAALS